MTISAPQEGQPRPLWDGPAPGLDEAKPRFTPTITPYLAGADHPVGAVVVCPGGGYAHRAPHEGEPIARRLNTFGISAFVCAYRHSPYRHPYPSLDAGRAVRWVRAHAAELVVKGDCVAILGFSAGGHLAATVGTHYDGGNPRATDPVERVSSRPDAMVLCYPVISFGEYGHQGSMNNLLGEAPTPDLVASLSNETQVTAETPPTFLWHTADDGGVPVQNSLLFASALAAHRVPFELHIYQSGRHGLGLAEDDPHIATWMELCGQWLKSRGF